MSEKEEIDLIIERAYEACQFDELRTYINQLEKRLNRLTDVDIKQKPLWPSLTIHIDQGE